MDSTLGLGRHQPLAEDCAHLVGTRRQCAPEGESLPKFPSPPLPADLAEIEPAIMRLRAGTRVWRVYFRGGPHPGRWNRMRTFGPTTARFDHHLPDALGEPTEQTRALQYPALDGITPLAEVFQDTRVIDRAARSPWLVAYELATDLGLLDLSGAYPTRAGASMRINCGSRPRARAWSRAFYDAYPEIQGLYYASCMHENRPSLALYERAAGAIPARPCVHRALSDQALRLLLRNAAVKLNYFLL